MNKDLLQSKTTYGILIMLLTPVLAKYGLDAGMVSDLVGILGGGIGALMGLYGRYKAQDAISTIAGIPLKK